MLFSYDDEAVAEIMGLMDAGRAPGTKAPGTKAPGTKAPGTKVPGTKSSARAVELSPVSIEKAVAEGLPRSALRRVAEAIVGGDTTKIPSLEWRVVPKTTLDRRTDRLSLPESERTERIARLFVHARRALGTKAEAREFMTMPHPELDGRTPLEVAATELGARRAEQILNALEYGLAL